MKKKILLAVLISLLSLVLNLSDATSATVDWSWDYGTEEPTIISLTSSSSFDINIKITNEASSDTSIYLAPYAIPDDYYYEGFYEFQSNIDLVVNTIIQSGETVYLNIGTWVPVEDGPAPYVNIQAQPNYLEVYYFDDNGDLLFSGQESLNPLELTIWGALDPAPFDPYNPGQGIIITQGPIYTPPQIYTPIPSSMLLFSFGLIGFAGVSRRKNKPR